MQQRARGGRRGAAGGCARGAPGPAPCRGARALLHPAAGPGPTRTRRCVRPAGPPGRLGVLRGRGVRRAGLSPAPRAGAALVPAVRAAACAPSPARGRSRDCAGAATAGGRAGLRGGRTAQVTSPATYSRAADGQGPRGQGRATLQPESQTNRLLIQGLSPFISGLCDNVCNCTWKPGVFIGYI